MWLEAAKTMNAETTRWERLRKKEADDERTAREVAEINAETAARLEKMRREAAREEILRLAGVGARAEAAEEAAREAALARAARVADAAAAADAATAAKDENERRAAERAAELARAARVAAAAAAADAEAAEVERLAEVGRRAEAADEAAREAAVPPAAASEPKGAAKCAPAKCAPAERAAAAAGAAPGAARRVTFLVDKTASAKAAPRAVRKPEGAAAAGARSAAAATAGAPRSGASSTNKRGGRGPPSGRDGGAVRGRGGRDGGRDGGRGAAAAPRTFRKGPTKQEPQALVFLTHMNQGTRGPCGFGPGGEDKAKFCGAYLGREKTMREALRRGLRVFVYDTSAKTVSGPYGIDAEEGVVTDGSLMPCGDFKCQAKLLACSTTATVHWPRGEALPVGIVDGARFKALATLMEAPFAPPSRPAPPRAATVERTHFGVATQQERDDLAQTHELAAVGFAADEEAIARDTAEIDKLKAARDEKKAALARKKRALARVGQNLARAQAASVPS